MLSSAAFQACRLSSWFLPVVTSGLLRVSEARPVRLCTLRAGWPEIWWDVGVVGDTGVKNIQFLKKERDWEAVPCLSWASAPRSCAGTCSAVPHHGQIGPSTLGLFARQLMNTKIGSALGRRCVSPCKVFCCLPCRTPWKMLLVCYTLL